MRAACTVLLLVLTAAVACGIVACGSNSTTTASPTPATSPTVDLLTTVDGYMAGWNAHNPVQAATYLAPNMTYLDMTVGTPVKGAAAAEKQVIASFIHAAPNCVWTRDTSKTIVGDHAVSYVWTFSGKNTGKWGDGTAPANKTFKFSGQTYMTFTPDGKILNQADYYDAYGFYKQLGWIK
jgi:hypothetical protein